MLHPTGYLLNAITKRYHPIVFRVAPMPGDADASMSAQRFKSIGHHTDGFDTIELAQAHVAEPRELPWTDVGVVWEWDGTSTPAMVEFFERPK